jgi:glucose-6-phosphate isomerase
MTLRIDYSNMMISPGGVDPKAWSAAGKQFADAKIGFDALRATGSVGFPDLPIDRPLLEQVTKFSAAARGKYDDVVILGIGGSALGPIALRTALQAAAAGTCSTKRLAADIRDFRFSITSIRRRSRHFWAGCSSRALCSW